MNPFEKHLPSNQAVKFYKNQFCRQTDPQFVKHRNVKDQFAYQVDLDDDYAFLMAQDVASIRPCLQEDNWLWWWWKLDSAYHAK